MRLPTSSVSRPVLFCIATFFAMTGLWLLTRQYEPPMKREPQPAIRDVLAILRQSEFRRGTIFFFIWNFGIGLSAAFVAKHMKHHMHMSYMMMLLYPVIVNVIGMFVARKWGRFIDRFGIRNTMLICASIASFAPFLWIFTAPGVTWPVWVDAVLTGSLMTGMNIAASNLPLVVTPERNKLHYLAIFSTLTGLGLGIACVISGKIAMVLDGVTLTLPGVPNPVINYHIIFVFSAALRLTSLLFLLRLYDARSTDLSIAVSALLRNIGRPFKALTRLLARPLKPVTRLLAAKLGF